MFCLGSSPLRHHSCPNVHACMGMHAQGSQHDGANDSECRLLCIRGRWLHLQHACESRRGLDSAFLG